MAVEKSFIDRELCDTTVMLGIGQTASTYLASSPMLGMASKKWREMLSAPHDQDGKVLKIPVGDADALVIILDLVHQQYDRLETKIKDKQLINVAHLAYVYDLRTFLLKSPFSKMWSEVPNISVLPPSSYPPEPPSPPRSRSPPSTDPWQSPFNSHDFLRPSRPDYQCPQWLKLIAVQTLGAKQQFVSVLKDFMLSGKAPGEDVYFVETDTVKELSAVFKASPIYDVFLEERRALVRDLNRICVSSMKRLKEGHRPCRGCSGYGSPTTRARKQRDCAGYMIGKLMFDGGVDGIAKKRVDDRDVCDLESAIVPPQSVSEIIRDFKSEWSHNEFLLIGHRQCGTFITDQIDEVERTAKKWEPPENLLEHFNNRA